MQRRECAWCGEPGRWPDRCAEDIGDPVCSIEIPTSCAAGDHRRCSPAACDSAQRWHSPVSAAGVRAARRAGAVYGVVSIVDGYVSVVGTADHLGHAKSRLRTPAARAGGFTGPAVKGVVYVVRAEDGAFL